MISLVIDEKELVDEYEINPLTMMILPYEVGNKTYSKIVEFENTYISPLRPTELVKRGCEYNLSDYNASKKVTRRLTRVTHKAPIAIDPSNSVFLLPTKSPTKSSCIWVSHEHVIDHRRHDAYSTKVTFRNKETFVLPISYISFEKQLLRTSELRTKVLQKMRENERKAAYIIYGRRHPEDRFSSMMVNERYRFDD
jgi:competence protein ComK